MTADEQTSILIVGGGLIGLASALFLAEQGVRPILVDRHPGVSIHGRARGINQRTMEIYRAFGVDQAIYEAGRPFEDEGGVAFCSTLSGDWQWLHEEDAPRAWPDLTAAEYCMADQNTVEPILIEAAAAKGAVHRFNTELVALDVDQTGATATVLDRATEQRSTIRADYVIAADGNRSSIRQQLGIDRPGHRVFQNSMNIVFRADLSAIVKRRALFWIIVNPEIGLSGGMVTTADPQRWQLTTSYDPETEGVAEFTVERCTSLVRGAMGVPDLAVEIEDVAAWEQGVGVAERYYSNRVFLAGDSAHVWPPAGAMGANTGVQDAHNLAWKLAGVVHGWADSAVLDTYQAERLPVAEALAPRIVKAQEARMGGGGQSDDEDALGGADGGVQWTLGQRYTSAAVLDATNDAVLGGPMERQAHPGIRAPHLWLDHDGARIALHDLATNAFLLLTGVEGQPWVAAAEDAAQRLSVPLTAYRVGPAGSADLIDVEDEWLSRYNVGTAGAVLIRPDGYVAWLSPDAAPDATKALADALHHILGSPARV